MMPWGMPVSNGENSLIGSVWPRYPGLFAGTLGILSITHGHLTQRMFKLKTRRSRQVRG